MKSNIHELVSQLIDDTKGLGSDQLFAPGSSLDLFRPELTLCVVMVLVLLVQLFRWGRQLDSFYIAFAGSLIALFYAAPWQLLSDPGAFERTELFTGMLVYDGFTVFMRGILIGFLVLFTVFTKLSGIPDRDAGPDVYTLILGATLGMCLMASANHLLMVFMAVEMASVPSYALAGMMKGRKLGSEAALKYSVYGAGAAGVMLYGISLIAGLLNTAHLPTLAVKLADALPQMPSDEMMVAAVGGLMIAVGLAFKLSAVPFHFWCPDVFEGATAEVNAFLSVASKAAALALLVRVAVGFGAVPETAPAASAPAVEMAAAEPAGGGYFSVTDETAVKAEPAAAEAAAGSGNRNDRLAPARNFMAHLIALLAIITCTFGNLAAYGQTNIKRLLAYSTIAHAGYMMMAVPPILALVTVSPESARFAVSSLAIYLGVYLFMNLGAFAVVAFLRNEMRSEQIDDYAGLIRCCPGITICFALILFSLVGLPPLAGFIGKFAVFAALADGYRLTAHPYLIVLLVAGGINTAISLFYYLSVVKTMSMLPEPETRVPFNLPLMSLPGMFVLAITAPTAILILCWNRLGELALAAARFVIA